jgi:transposase InsO family protein
VQARKKDFWGGYKLHHHLIGQAKAGQIEARPDQIPAASTITAILDRHGLLADPDDASRRGSWKRFERDNPNELWQLDFKGEFRLSNHEYCYPLTLIDDHSRFSLVVAGCPNQKRQTVQGHLEQAFSRYGLPGAILCDNGPPWGAGLGWCDWGPYYTGLAVWLIRLGIEVIYCRPSHPQGKGKNERFNGTLKAELISREQLKDHDEAHARMAEWRNRYNTVRPHQALDMAPPISRYQSSGIPFTDQLSPVDYHPNAITRKVNSQGRIRFENQTFPVGKAFSGYPLMLRASSEHQEYEVYFCHQYIRSINLNNNN